MERKANLPPPPAPSIRFRPDAGEANHTSSSSSASSYSPPNFIRQIHAVFKRHRPLSTLQPNASRPSRVLVSQGEPPKANTVGASGLPNAALNPRNDGVSQGGGTPSENPSPTPPSFTSTMSGSSTQGGVAGRADENAKVATPASDGNGAGAGLDLQKGECHLRSRAVETGNDLNRGNLESIDTSGIGENLERDGLQDLHYADLASRSSAAAAAICATTMSVHTGPTVPSTHAPSGQTALSGQDHALPEARGTVLRKDDDGSNHHRQAPHLDEDIEEKGVPADASCLQSNVPSTSKPSKVEKDRRKKYDPGIFFKVNGKLYQKLGKIGSGGSSEVHKVISSDCTIYALKKIKLKGRDYPTAYGFCQEIQYLKRLKGKSNIIQLIDYEVTDKALLKEIVDGSMSTKDGKIRDDQYIYMVLEYGEIDLAHMLSDKWKDMDHRSRELDENWLRFYWQQMLEAVNTIHQERIVHSDLKPANFLLVRGSLKLIDFGIAKAIMSDTTNIQRDAQVGTLNYMSPEAFMWNEPDVNGNTIKCGRPSDIWSLGCILYQMVYGKTPFADYKTFWNKFKIITDRNHKITYELVSNPWLTDLMQKCLAWERNERWRLPQLLQHPFLVPPIPRELPLVQDNFCKLLMEKVGIYWDDPQVSRLCSELHEIVANLEKREKNACIKLR